MFALPLVKVDRLVGQKKKQKKRTHEGVWVPVKAGLRQACRLRTEHGNSIRRKEEKEKALNSTLCYN